MYLLSISISACAPVDTRIAGHFLYLEKEARLNSKAGTTQTLQLTFQLEEGFHIVDRRQAEELSLRTQLDIQSTEFLHWGTPIFPQPALYQLQGTDTSLPVYKNKLMIKIPVEVKAAFPKRKTLKLPASLWYQACDAQKCYFPKEYIFEVVVN